MDLLLYYRFLQCRFYNIDCNFDNFVDFEAHSSYLVRLTRQFYYLILITHESKKISGTVECMAEAGFQG